MHSVSSLYSLVGACGLALSSGCAHYTPAPISPVARVVSTPLSSFLVHEARSLRSVFPFYTLEHLDVTLAEGRSGVMTTNRVQFDYYRPRTLAHARVPLVLIPTVLGGEYTVERHAGELFARAGMPAVFVYGPSLRSIRSIEGIDTYYRARVRDSVGVLDWADMQHELHDVPRGVIGVGPSSTTAVHLGAHDGRVQKVMLGLGYGDFSSLFARSDFSPLVEARERVLRGEGLSLREGTNRLAILQYEPLLSAKDMRGEVLFIGMAGDSLVPRANQDALFNALGKPAHVTVYGGVPGLLLSLPLLEQRVVRFFTDDAQKR